MAEVSGQGTSYNLEYLVGALFKVATNEAPLVAMLGGMTGGKSVKSKQIPWQSIDNRTPSQPQIAEGADPTPRQRDRTPYHNVLQIFQDAVELTFTQQAVTAQVDGMSINVLGDQPVKSESALQTELSLEAMASDIDYTLFNGTFVDDTDGDPARRTKGLFEAADSSNVQDATDNTLTGVTLEADDDTFTKASHGLSVHDEVEITAITGGTGYAVGRYFVNAVPTSSTFTLAATRGGATVACSLDGTSITIKRRNPMTKARFEKLVRTMWDNGAKFRLPVLFGGVYQKQRLSNVYGFTEAGRTVGGIKIEAIEVDGVNVPVGVALVRNVPSDRLLLADLSVCDLAFLDIPANPQTGRKGGHLLMHPLAQTGASDTWQLYCEAGLVYGPPTYHGYIDGLTTDEGLS